MQIQPVTHKVLITIHSLRDTGSIVLPETVQELQPYGQVLSVGSDCKHTKIGDKVLFLPNAAIGIEHDGEMCYFIDEGSIFGKYVEPTALGQN